ncbi:MAG: methyltransferase type 11 [Bacteroidetes bacterium RIFCSPLOWO2_02_FULL_36_8]|nr:MAG: methyltransferase type 11 [Bacteroidetes bacterium RIFCSPLOWO2_02_FULL_36_8]OFY71015.1 MAG: methyltransferase type 11 [Bacteroidetes bacterium RIFCSPLOWO2_12_FULL_37_12]
MMKTKQEQFWSGDFGKEYTDRNPQNLEEWNKLYMNNYGRKKTDMNEDFLKNLNREARILEVGCNIGLQLLGLQTMGFKNLYGIELQSYAVEKAKKITKGINIIQGSGFDIPFKDRYFDMVYTAGVLIHIAPDNLPKIISEMIRCSRKYVWGFEYYSAIKKEINYRGNKGFLWKMDYANEFLKQDKSLKEVKRKIIPYINDGEKGNNDIMYLLKIC